MRVIEIRLCVTVEGENASELFENLAETARNIEDTVIQYGSLKEFTIKEIEQEEG